MKRTVIVLILCLTAACASPAAADVRIQEWGLPTPDGSIWYMAATPQGDVYIACSGVNKVGIVRAGGSAPS